MTDSETYEEDLPFERRLRAWLLEQPEYMDILALSRPIRRSGLRRVATIILSFPEANIRPGVNRKESRAQMNQLKRRLSKKLDKAQQRKSDRQREIDAHTRRVLRLTAVRLEWLQARQRAQEIALALLKEDGPLPAYYEANLLDDEARKAVNDHQLAEEHARGVAADDGYDIGGEG